MGRYDTVPASCREGTVLELIEEIRKIYLCCFETVVSAVLSNTMPGINKTLREIRSLISVVRVDGETIAVVRSGAEELEEFVAVLSKYFLPKAKELLQVSPLNPEARIRDRDVLLYRRFLICTLPENVGRLQELTGELKKILEIAY
ncbi:MAG: hypothetical protein ACLFRY_05295 [Spirochaetia bacterium]